MKLYRRIPNWVWAVLLGSVAVYLGCELAIRLTNGHGGASDWSTEAQAELKKWQALILAFLSLAYGVGRAAAFHPAARKGYREWLRTTPWRPEMPLPLGPVAFAWWDVLVLGSGLAMTCRHKPLIIMVVLAFALGYLTTAFLILLSTLPVWAYGMALAAAFWFRFALWLPGVMGIAVALIVFAHIGMIRSLRGFPWEKDPSHEVPDRLGWLTMIPSDTQPLISARAALATSVMVGCWTWAILSIVDMQLQIARTDAILFAMGATGVGSMARWLRYCESYRAPISPLDRLRSGRLVVPGYDQVLVAPAVAPIVAGVVAVAAAGTSAPVPLIVAVGSAAGLTVLLMAPPTFRDWQLTGFHRRGPFRKDSLASAQRRTRRGTVERLWQE